MEENKQMLELMQTIEDLNRKQLRASRLRTILTAVMAACCVGALLLVAGLVPQIREMLPRIQEMIAQAEVVLSNLEQTTTQLAAADLEGMVGNVNDLVASGQQTMDKLGTIDFEKLNQAITDLAAVVEGLARFFGLRG